MTAAFFFGVIAFVAGVANIAIRDHSRSVDARRRLLDECRGVFDEERWTAGGDGFPAIDGRYHGRAVKAALIPDTMVMRRLPQLWLAATIYDWRPRAPSLSVLARHTGAEFYAATHDLPQRIEAPAGLPLDVLIRGDGARADALCRALVPTLAMLLEDPRVKEITMTPKGVRIIRQVAEGSRGEHLLLRQAVFTAAAVTREDFTETVSEVDALVRARDAALQERAA